MHPAPRPPSLPGFIKRSCALLAALISLAFAGNAEAARGRPSINAAGTTFVTDTGTLIRGAIISTETGNVPTLSAVQGIKTRGLNAIHCYAERADYGYAAGRHYAALDQVVQMTRDNDLYLVITIGGGGVNVAFVQDFWTFYAPRYANETHVIYEIQNEPVVRPPVSASVIDMEKAAWNIIRAAAPHTPVLLMSYTIFQNSTGVLADIAALGSTIDWSNAAIAFHGYGEYGPDATRACLTAVMNAGYACFQTEFYRWPWGTGDFDLVDPPSLYQSVDETGDLERLGVSWLTFLSLARVMDDTRFKDRLDNGGVVWTPDFGTWPSGSRSVYGNGREPRAIRSTVTTRIEAEDFDNGGPGKAYHDTTSGNSGNQYRPGEDVDIQATSDTGGGYNVGWIGTGEWLEYTVNVKNPGRYTLNVRVAAPTASGSLRLRLAGVDLTGAWAVPATGDYQAWTTLSKTVDLVPGQQILRFETITSGFNLNWIEFVPVSSGLIANGTCKIINRNSGKAMDVVNASTANGAKIQQWGYAGTGNQQWVFTHRGANQYTVTSAQTGKAIDQAAGFVLSGDHIQMYSLNSSSANQRWIPVPTDSGYYKLVSANTGLVLAVADSSTANGARIIQQEFSGLPGQQWWPGAPSDPAPQAWRLQWFGTTEDAGDAANLAAPAGDGIANLLKLATGDGTTDPRVPGIEPGEIALDEPGEFFEFTWPRNKAALADGVVFTVTWSDTLAPESWSDAGVVVTRVEDEGATERVTVAIPRGEGDRRFARLEVTADGQTAVTTPQGVTTLRLPGDGATGVIGINLIAKPAYTGPVSAVGTNTVTVDAVDLDPRMDAGRAYALLVTGGSHAGVHTRITGRDGSVLTLADDLTSRLAPGEDTIRITELPTLLDIFGTGGEVLAGGPAATADLVMVRDSTGSGDTLSLYYATGGINGAGWRAAGKGAQDFGDYPIYFTDGVSVLKRSPGPAGIELTGGVQEARVSLVVEEGFAAYATVFAAGVTLGASDLYQADRPDRSIRAGTTASADHIHFDTDGDGILETWYYASGGINGIGWRRVGGGPAPCDSVEVPSGFFILRKSLPVTIDRERPW